MEYQICKRCVMDDSSDSTITFDKNGFCNYCTTTLKQINTTKYFPGEAGKEKLEAMLAKIKTDGKGKPYDCVMGISGGLDSSYLAYLGHKWGLRILAVHIDDGFDTEISKLNIEKLCKVSGINLEVITPDAVQFNALIKAYMRAGVPNLAAPQDNVLFAYLYKRIRETGVKYFLSGGNFALECVLQHGNTHGAYDTVNIRDIHKKFADEPMDKIKLITAYRKAWDQRIMHIETLRPLNYIDYNRERAFAELKDYCGFEYYGSKHLENILTAFVQLYWFPKKFNVDKRKSHLSSMIVSGQMTRDQAIAELKKPICDEKEINNYIAIIKKNLDISDSDFDDIMRAETHQHTDYRYDIIEPFIRKHVHHL